MSVSESAYNKWMAIGTELRDRLEANGTLEAVLKSDENSHEVMCLRFVCTTMIARANAVRTLVSAVVRGGMADPRHLQWLLGKVGGAEFADKPRESTKIDVNVNVEAERAKLLDKLARTKAQIEDELATGTGTKAKESN